ASPYLLGPVRHVARVEVDGADLVTAEVNAGGDAGLLLTMRVHLGEDQYHVQLTGLTEEDAPVIAHQVLAGLRAKGRAGGRSGGGDAPGALGGEGSQVAVTWTPAILLSWVRKRS